MAKKRLALVEIVGPLMLLINFLMMVSYENEFLTDERGRTGPQGTVHSLYSLLLYISMVLFSGVSYLPHTVFRVLFGSMTHAYFMVEFITSEQH